MNYFNKVTKILPNINKRAFTIQSTPRKRTQPANRETKKQNKSKEKEDNNNNNNRGGGGGLLQPIIEDLKGWVQGKRPIPS